MKTKSFSIEISDEAEIDLDKSYAFYHQDSPKVADTFFKQINIAFDNIRQSPKSFPIVYKSVRKYVVKKFPFVIYYQLVDKLIQIVAIFHTSRNPEIWNARI